MGAGNPLIRSYDPELYTPQTYFIDFTENNDEIEDEYDANFIAQDFCDWFKSLDFLPDNLDFDIPSDNCKSELSAAFKSYGIILAEFKHSLLVTTSDSELNHFAIGIIPNFKYEEIFEDAYQNLQPREYWYAARNLNFNDAVDRQAMTFYRRRITKQFKKEAQKISNCIIKQFGHIMRIRNGAWISTPLNKK